MKNEKILLFSYGTLQDKNVQIETFGRVLVGSPDNLLNYKLAILEIKDPVVATLSGKSYHPIAIFEQDAHIKGTVFEISDQELTQSDAYEVDDYERVLAKMSSGMVAWAYVSAR